MEDLATGGFELVYQNFVHLIDDPDLDDEEVIELWVSIVIVAVSLGFQSSHVPDKVYQWVQMYGMFGDTEYAGSALRALHTVLSFVDSGQYGSFLQETDQALWVEQYGELEKFFAQKQEG